MESGANGAQDKVGEGEKNGNSGGRESVEGER